MKDGCGFNSLTMLLMYARSCCFFVNLKQKALITHPISLFIIINNISTKYDAFRKTNGDPLSVWQQSMRGIQCIAPRRYGYKIYEQLKQQGI